MPREHAKRLLFASIHSDLEPSGGAALSKREPLKLLAAREANCWVFTAGVLDYERKTTLDDVLAGLELPSQSSKADLGRPVVARSLDPATSVEVMDRP